MTRKAAAKSSEADAAVLSRAAGLDQRFKMSASVAGFPSINAATSCLSSCIARVGRCGHSGIQCCNCYKSHVPKAFSGNLRWKIYAVQNSCSAAVVTLGNLLRFSR